MRQVDRRLQTGRQHLFDSWPGLVFEHPECAGAGIVDQYIDTKILGGAGHQGNAFGTGQIGDDQGRTCAERRAQRLQPGGIAAGQ